MYNGGQDNYGQQQGMYGSYVPPVRPGWSSQDGGGGGGSYVPTSSPSPYVATGGTYPTVDYSHQAAGGGWYAGQQQPAGGQQYGAQAPAPTPSYDQYQQQPQQYQQQYQAPPPFGQQGAFQPPADLYQNHNQGPFGQPAVQQQAQQWQQPPADPFQRPSPQASLHSAPSNTNPPPQFAPASSQGSAGYGSAASQGSGPYPPQGGWTAQQQQQQPPPSGYNAPYQQPIPQQQQGQAPTHMQHHNSYHDPQPPVNRISPPAPVPNPVAGVGATGQAPVQQKLQQPKAPDHLQKQKPIIQDSEVHDLLKRKLPKAVNDNGLDAFYSAAKLDAVIQHLRRVDFRLIARRWSNLEIATDLACLALYDIVLYVDDSKSMKDVDKGNSITFLTSVLNMIAELVAMWDDDGINIRAMNAPNKGENIRTVLDVKSYIKNLKFNGMTPLGTELERKVIEPFFYRKRKAEALKKPLLVITITDGEPTNEKPNKIIKVIKAAKEVAEESKYGENALAFEFAQVGQEPAATSFLKKLNKDKEVGKCVHVTNSYQSESKALQAQNATMTMEIWLAKVLLGSIDKDYIE